MTAAQERRAQETLARCTTEAQRATVARLQADDVSVYTEKRQGATVVAEARRYFTTGDVSKLGTGLYHFSIYGLNEIAHYNLDGFRRVYRDVRDYLRFLGQSAAAGARKMEYSVYAYTDGMTDREVLDAVLKLADEHRERIFAEGDAADKAAALAEAQRLAASLGMKVVAA